MEKVVCLLMTSGMEVICKLVRAEDGGVVIRKPHMIAATGQGVMLVPMMISCSDDAEFYLSKSTFAICSDKVSHEMENAYLERTSGLTLL